MHITSDIKGLMTKGSAYLLIEDIPSQIFAHPLTGSECYQFPAI